MCRYRCFPIFCKCKILNKHWSSSAVTLYLWKNSWTIFFIKNELNSSNQSGFKPGDSCVNHLLSITQKVYKSSNEGHEVGDVFLNISKEFDRMWHDGVIFKLNQNGMSGNLLKLLRNFLSERRQRLVLNGLHIFKWHCWSTSGFHSWSIIVFNVYKWSFWRTSYQC